MRTGATYTIFGEQAVAIAVIPLARARLCSDLDCNTIFDMAYRTCPVCASSHWMPLAVWDRQRRPAAEER